MITREWVKNQFQNFSDYMKLGINELEKGQSMDELFKTQFAQTSIGKEGLFAFSSPYYDRENKRLFWVARDASKTVNGVQGINYLDMSNPTKPVFGGFSTFGIDEIGILNGYNIRAINKFGDYLFIIVRSSAANIPSDGVNNNSIWGALVCVKASELTVVWTKTFNAKGCDVKILNSSNGTIYMALSFQMSYIQFYSIDPNDNSVITLRDTHYTQAFKNVSGWTNGYDDGVTEHQYGNFVEHDGQVLYVSAGFGDGIHIYDVTNIMTEPATLYNYQLVSPETGKKVHTFDCAIDYPYVYCTLAPNDRSKTSLESIAGVITLNISDLTDIQDTFTLMNTEDISSQSSGDWRPTTIQKHDKYLYLNNREKGIALFEIVEHIPQYVGCYQLDDFMVGELGLIDEGILIVGEAPEGMTHPNGSAPTEEGTRLYYKDKQLHLFDVTGGMGTAKFLYNMGNHQGATPDITALDDIDFNNL